VRDVRLEQLNRGDWALSAAGAWSDPQALVAHLRDNTNFFPALDALDWRNLCGDGARVLDLGCGSGWLSAVLTREPHVGRVVAWDSSPRLLGDVLPVTVDLLGGDMRKIEPVCGDFVPLLIEDRSIDLAVMSSAFHHCDRPDDLLDELRRVLVPGGCLVLLNETPWHRLVMASFSLRTAGAALANLIGPRSRLRRPGHLAVDHVLYDPRLGDRAMTLPQWRALAGRRGWSIEPRDTGLASYRGHFRSRRRLEPNLTHFVLRPGPARAHSLRAFRARSSPT
jgi:SAM-dependent methyltransferase